MCVYYLDSRLFIKSYSVYIMYNTISIIHCTILRLDVSKFCQYDIIMQLSIKYLKYLLIFERRNIEKKCTFCFYISK